MSSSEAEAECPPLCHCAGQAGWAPVVFIEKALTSSICDQGDLLIAHPGWRGLLFLLGWPLF